MAVIVPPVSAPTPPAAATITAPAVQVVFTDGALTVTVGGLQSFTTGIGRSSPRTDAAGAGEASLLIRDTSRVLDPDNSSSSLYGHLTPGGTTTVQLQVWNGTIWVPLYTGMIDSLTTSYPGAGINDVALHLVDAARDLNLHIPASGTIYPQQQSGARISQMVGAQSRSAWGWINRAPSGSFNIDAGQKVLTPLTTDGQTSTWQYITNAALAEKGVVFFDQGGVLTYQDQIHRFRSSTPRFTFGDDHTSEVWVEQSLTYSFSNDRMLADVAYNSGDGFTSGYGRGGSFQWLTATTTQNTSQVTGTDTGLADRYQAAARSRWEFEHYSVNRRDAPTVDINAFGEWPTITGNARFGVAIKANLGDYVQLNRRPTVGSTITKFYWIDQIQHNFTGGQNPTWMTTFTFAAADQIFTFQQLGTTTIGSVTALPW
jgi:hypothetical protein